jgi:hypothetical protein
MQIGTGYCAVGTDPVSPPSRWNYEILSGIWSDSRFREVQDIKLGILGKIISDRDVTLTRLVSPSIGSSGKSKVSVILKNVGGSLPNAITLNYKVNNDTTVSEIYLGRALSPGDSTVFTFKRQTSFQLNPSGGDSILVWAEMAGDIDRSNDTLSAAIGFPLAVSSLVEEQTRIFPNPFNQKIHIQGSMNYKRIQLFSIDGRELPIQFTQDNNIATALSLCDMDAGVYIVKLERYDGRVLNYKIVKE